MEIINYKASRNKKKKKHYLNNAWTFCDKWLKQTAASKIVYWEKNITKTVYYALGKIKIKKIRKRKRVAKQSRTFLSI